MNDFAIDLTTPFREAFEKEHEIALQALAVRVKEKFDTLRADLTQQLSAPLVETVEALVESIEGQSGETKKLAKIQEDQMAIQKQQLAILNEQKKLVQELQATFVGLGEAIKAAFSRPVMVDMKQVEPIMKELLEKFEKATARPKKIIRRPVRNKQGEIDYVEDEYTW